MLGAVASINQAQITHERCLLGIIRFYHEPLAVYPDPHSCLGRTTDS